MTRKPAAKKKNSQTRKPTFVTLRQIEDGRPCESEYWAFLNDFASNACDPDCYPGSVRRREPRYGADDPIPLADILRKKSSGEKNGHNRLAWLIVNLKSLSWLAKARDRIDNDFHKRIADLQRQLESTELDPELVAMITGKKE